MFIPLNMLIQPRSRNVLTGVLDSRTQVPNRRNAQDRKRRTPVYRYPQTESLELVIFHKLSREKYINAHYENATTVGG